MIKEYNNANKSLTIIFANECVGKKSIVSVRYYSGEMFSNVFKGHHPVRDVQGHYEL